MSLIHTYREFKNENYIECTLDSFLYLVPVHLEPYIVPIVLKLRSLADTVVCLKTGQIVKSRHPIIEPEKVTYFLNVYPKALGYTGSTYKTEVEATRCSLNDKLATLKVTYIQGQEPKVEIVKT